jgi:hypothetical protein
MATGSNPQGAPPADLGAQDAVSSVDFKESRRIEQRLSVEHVCARTKLLREALLYDLEILLGLRHRSAHNLQLRNGDVDLGFSLHRRQAQTLPGLGLGCFSLQGSSPCGIDA